jgi:hypothetical protein
MSSRESNREKAVPVECWVGNMPTRNCLIVLPCLEQVGYQNRKIFMGYYSAADDAARAYDKKLVELHGAQGSVRLHQ